MSDTIGFDDVRQITLSDLKSMMLMQTMTMLSIVAQMKKWRGYDLAAGMFEWFKNRINRPRAPMRR